MLLALTPAELFAHGVTAGDKGYIQSISGIGLMPFAYVGAKHTRVHYFGATSFLAR